MFVVCSTLTFGFTDRGFESKSRNGYFSHQGASALNKLRSLAKGPLTLEIAQFIHSLSTQLATLWRRRMYVYKYDCISCSAVGQRTQLN